MEYVAERNPGAASRLGSAILRGVGRLEQFPHLGHVFHKLGRDDVREIPVRPYRIFYRVIEPQSVVYVLTVWHGARQEPDFQGDEIQ
ncbi:MAG: type II toxin-antitoxin system RelE/ParE family toxin [Limisphaerales bacterium]